MEWSIAEAASGGSRLQRVRREEALQMIGPLPRLHRVVVVASVIAAAIASGAWIAHVTVVPIDPVAGATLGLVAGALLAYAVLHAGPVDHRHTEPVRHRRR